jgi:circadian clock protein KaiC
MDDIALTDLMDAAVGQELEKAPTGITGLDQITRGGLPLGRVTLVAGSTGTGKTLLGLEFLVAGARDYGEPGVLMTFEESKAKVALNVRSLGFDLDELVRDGPLEVLSFRVDPGEIFATGEFDFEPLFTLLGEAIRRTGAKRVVLDAIEVLFGSFGDDSTVRSELRRLTRWLEDHGVTAIVTGERGDKGLTRHAIEEYVTDCVIMLDHRVSEEVSTRRLRVVKYRGSAHGTNEYPFLISASGFVVLPVTSIVLDYEAPDERISTGVGRLDHMLGGGLFRGSTLMVSGTAGTGKTSVGAHLVDSACARGEQVLLVLFEESPDQFLRNMQSIGFDLRPRIEQGLLRIWASRPSAVGPETHLAMLARLIEERPLSVAVLDGVPDLAAGDLAPEALSMVARQIDLLKARGITSLVTALSPGDDISAARASSMVDTWLQLRNVEANGERNRLLFVLKSRGTAHSNQVREFVLTDHGVELVDVYVGAAGVLAGSARQAQQAAERDADVRQDDDLSRRRRELHRSVMEREAHLVAVQDQLDAERAEIDRIDLRERHQAADSEADRSAMATRRWADPAPGKGGSDGSITHRG